MDKNIDENNLINNQIEGQVEDQQISKWKLHCMWISSLIVFIGVLYFEYSNGH